LLGALSPDGRRIATGYFGTEPEVRTVDARRVVLWDGRTGKQLGSILRYFARRLTGGVETLQFSGDGRRLLILYGPSAERAFDPRVSQVVEVVDVAGGQVLAQRIFPVAKRLTQREGEVRMKVRHAELSPDGRRVLLLLGDNERVQNRNWSVTSGNRPSLAGPLDPLVYLWELGRDDLARLVGHRNDVAAAHFSADGRRVITASLDGTAKLWDVLGGDGVVHTVEEHEGPLALARFSPDGQWVVTARGLVPPMRADDRRPPRPEAIDPAVRLWDVASDRQTAVLLGTWPREGQGGKELDLRRRLLGAAQDVAFSSDGKRLLTLSLDNQGRRQGPAGKELPLPYTPVRIWDVATGRQVAALQGILPQPQRAAFSPDGRFVLIVAVPVKMDVLLAEDGRSLHNKVAFETRNRVELWDAATGKRLRPAGPDEIVAQALWAPDSRRVFLFGQRGAWAWDALAGKPLYRLDGPIMSRAALSPDGKRLVGYQPFEPGRRDAML
jgi:WD40 repeat protein